MDIVAIIRLLLSVTDWLMKQASDAQQRRIGRDGEILRNAEKIVRRAQIAKQIDNEFEHLGANDVDERLREYYRD